MWSLWSNYCKIWFWCDALVVLFLWGWLFFFYGANHFLLDNWFVQYIKVREWTAILPSGIILKNAYRQRAAASDSAPLPQTFTFMRRGFMPRRAQGLQVSDRLPRSMRTDDMETQDNDVLQWWRNLCLTVVYVRTHCWWCLVSFCVSHLAVCWLRTVVTVLSLLGWLMLIDLQSYGQFKGPFKKIFLTCAGQWPFMILCWLGVVKICRVCPSLPFLSMLIGKSSNLTLHSLVHSPKGQSPTSCRWFFIVPGEINTSSTMELCWWWGVHWHESIPNHGKNLHASYNGFDFKMRFMTTVCDSMSLP